MEKNTFLEEFFDEIGHTDSLKMENILLSFIRIISAMSCVYHVNHVMFFFFFLDPIHGLKFSIHWFERFQNYHKTQY